MQKQKDNTYIINNKRKIINLTQNNIEINS